MKPRQNTRARSLEARALQVLQPAGTSREELREAYFLMAKKHHPDTADGDADRFQLVREAYAILAFGEINTPSLLADDELVTDVAHQRPEPLHGEEAMKDYTQQVRSQFFWDW